MRLNIFEWSAEVQAKLSSIQEALESIENPSEQVRAALIELAQMETFENENSLLLTDIELDLESRLICDCRLDAIELDINLLHGIITVNAQVDSEYCDKHQPGIDFEKLSFSVLEAKRVVQGGHLISCPMSSCSCALDCLKEIMENDNT